MLKILYQGPIHDHYSDGNFYGLMINLGASVILNSTIPHPQNPALIGFVVNAFNLDNVKIIYHSSYNLRQGGGLDDGLATIIGEGQPAEIGEVERKIEEGAKSGLHLTGIQGLIEINVQPRLLQVQRKSDFSKPL